MEHEEGEEAGTIRLAKLMARRGLCSRREAEAWIADGRVTVDGQVVSGPMGVDPDTQVIKVDGKRLPPSPTTSTT
jgi:23S rRNA pseudouridine2605 synthase